MFRRSSVRGEPFPEVFCGGPESAMNLLRHQRTLSQGVELTGYGYWHGQKAHMRLRPAPVGHGRVFWLRGRNGVCHAIPARIEWRSETPRRTSLTRKDMRVEMIEHLMAVMAAFQVDNCLIELDAIELPAFDGSGLPIAQAIQQAGTRPQPAWQAALVIDRTIRVQDGVAWIEASPGDEPGLYLEYHLDYGPGPIGRQELGLWVTSASFVEQLAPARSFLLQEEAVQLRRSGLGQHVTYRDVLVFGPDGPVDNTLRFVDECVRHKLLDLLGDLALAGADIHGRIVAHRSGHRLNARFVQLLCERCGLWRQVRAA